MAGSSPDDSTVVDTSLSGTPADTSSTQSTTNTTDVAATSSTAQKPAETILDRVKSILPENRGGSPPSETPGTPAKPDSTTPAKTDDSDELPADEAKTAHPKTHERFRKLTSDLKASKSEAEGLRPKAQEYDKIDTFIRNAGLKPEDVGSTLQIAALLRTDKRAALERLSPIVDELRRAVGEVLPAELQSRVDQGLLTAEDALALNRASAAASMAEQRASRLLESQQQEATSRTQQAAVDKTLDAIDTWEKAQAKNDPDWHQKQAEVSELVELAITRKSNELKTNWWPNPEEAIQLSKDALAKIGERYKRFTPKPRAIDPPVTAGASPRSTPAPKNTMDIVQRFAGARG